MQIMVKIPSEHSDDENCDPNLIKGDNGLVQRKLKPLNDWAIIEMQGDLESRVGDVQLEGKFVGDLHFTKTDHTPVLIIGHHILYGKVVTLDKPLVIMEKSQKQSKLSKEDSEALNQLENGDNAMDMDNDDNEGSTETIYNVRAIIRKKLLFKSRPKPIIANVPKKI